MSSINYRKFKKEVYMRTFTRLIVVVTLTVCCNLSIAQPRMMFVKNVSNNADIYFTPDVNTPGIIRQLTNDSGIDNHPDFHIMTVPPYDTVVVWSSNRTGNFEIYIGMLPDLESPPPTQLTFNNYSDRHPHLSEDGQWIVCTGKYRFEPATVCPKSECSVPVNEPCGWYEGLHIINVSTGTIYELDLRNMAITGGGTWPSTFDTWIGHPSFNESGTKILFSAAVDPGGTSWEVYTVDFLAPNTISNLTRVTQGTDYPSNPNPIQMSAGAHFASGETEIIYSSTRTPLGNSQIFRVAASSVNATVNPLNQLTWNYGNDYVPEELSDGTISMTSDLGPMMCAPPDTGASMDLDLMRIDPDGGGRTNLTNNDYNDEMLLIGDEVSWFCGIKPNLSECTYYPKYWNICWWKELYRMGTDPDYLPSFPKRNQYTQEWQNIQNYLSYHDPVYLQSIMDAMTLNWSTCEVSWMNVLSWWTIPTHFLKWDPLLPANPALVSPSNGAVNGAAITPLDWTDVSGATSYGIEIDATPSFTSPAIHLMGLPMSQFEMPLPAGKYYWRASATNGSGTSWSTVNYFTVAPPMAMFVKNVANNADIFYMPDVNNPAVIKRLTTNPWVDNHPDYHIMDTPPFDTVVVWSSNRTGNFEIYMSTLPDLDVPPPTQLTFNMYSDRHPHLSHNGQWIVCTGKYRFEPSTVCPKSECSIPVNEPCGWYEGLHIINVSTGTVYEIDLRLMPITGGGFWPATFDTWIGHPSFNEMNDKIIFSAAVDEAGTSWEVYTVDIMLPNFVSNLTRVTNGTLYPSNPNPIQMSAGAHFANDETEIIYSSTRTPLGNSQIFKVPATSVGVPVDPVNQVTWNYGNDYVPEQLADGRFLISSDLGPMNCPPPAEGASLDLDVMLVNQDGTGRINLTNNDLNDEMLLIGDEVSWFCGIKPNLSECTYYPKNWNICWFKEFYRMGTDPSYLPDFPKRNQYTQAWLNVTSWFNTHDPQYLQSIMSAMFENWTPCEESWLNVQSWWIVPSIYQKWDPALPANPALESPSNGAFVVSPVINFNWTDIPGATEYGIQVDITPTFTAPVINMSGLSTSVYTTSVTSGRTYYWRASATNPAGTSWSTVNTFITGSASVTWNGSVSSDWSASANWSPTFVPNGFQTVQIPAGTPFPPVAMTPDLACNNLTINPGAIVQFIGTSPFSINGTLTIMNGGMLMNQSTVRIKGSLLNQNAGLISFGPGTFEFIGTSGQAMVGNNMFQNMTLDNSAGLMIGGDIQIDGVLTLVNGRIILGSNNLLLGPSAYISAWPSASRMVVATGSGELRKEFTVTGPFTFPVGDVDGTVEYSPVTLDFTSGTFTPGNYAGVNLINAQYPGTATSFLNRSWQVSRSGSASETCHATFKYVPADVVGTESDIFCTKVSAAPWITYNAANTTLHEIDAWLDTFSTFTGNLGNGTVPPEVRSLQQKTISAGMVSCADATQTILIAGSGSTYVVENGGSVNHIAGINILYYPGTQVDEGGYMHGYISTSYCSPYIHPAPAGLPGDLETEDSGKGNDLFRIYPNPTPGTFTLELKDDLKRSRIQVEILGILGNRILSRDLIIDRKHEFSLVGRPSGVYIIHVTSGVNSGIEMIIKK